MNELTNVAIVLVRDVKSDVGGLLQSFHCEYPLASSEARVVSLLQQDFGIRSLAAGQRRLLSLLARQPGCDENEYVRWSVKFAQC